MGRRDGSCEHTEERKTYAVPPGTVLETDLLGLLGPPAPLGLVCVMAAWCISAPAEKRGGCPCLSPWVVAVISILVLSTCFISSILVTWRWDTRTRHEEQDKLSWLRRYPKEKTCVSEAGKGQVWTCCPRGWELFQASCYYFSNDIMTWDDSERNCTGMDSHLVVINTGAEQDFIFTRVNGTVTGSEGRNYCIGLTDKEKKGQWHWVDETPYNDTAAFWRPGEPNNDPSEYCAVMHVEGKQTKHGNRNWNDIACFKLYNRICETAALIF
ncbi:C-type lectin domain family 6 member A-like [Trachemys scripta elegans]|uniref:C-type lectin domain family 6 member A-like n=1 Tax=Trachemys scripta elegans TaxID=31138 RepID=UPI001556E41F|nr:C-type lectin domain family 6 member A-like [Trachemys scripta elegans]